MYVVQDPNPSNPSCPTDEIPKDKKWVLLVVACNLEKDIPKLKKDTKIIIELRQWQIDKSIFSHSGELKFGSERKRDNNDQLEAHIKFDESDLKISRDQFLTKFEEGLLSINCLIEIPSRKFPTSIRITPAEFYLERNHIFTFGKKNSLTFRVSDISENNKSPSIEVQMISLNPDDKGRKYSSFLIKYEGEKVIGSYGLLDSSNLKQYNIILGFNKIKSKWYLFEEKETVFGNKHETFVYLFKYDEIEWGKGPTKSKNWVKLEENTVISVGEYYLRVEK